MVYVPLWRRAQQHKPGFTHAECLGTKVQLYMSHNTVCSQTSISFTLSSHVCHASHGESTCAFRGTAHVTLRVLGWCFQLHAGNLDCLARVHAAVYNMFLQHAKLPMGLTFTNQTPSDLILLPFRHFLFKPFALCVSLQPCWPLSVSKLIQLPVPVGSSGCLPGLFGMDHLFSFLWPNFFLDSEHWFSLQRQHPSIIGTKPFSPWHFFKLFIFICFKESFRSKRIFNC